MPRQLSLSALIELPTDLFEASEITNSVKTPWQTLLQGLKDKGVKFTHAQDITETRATTGAKRGRKPRVVAVPVVGVSPWGKPGSVEVDPKTTEAA